MDYECAWIGPPDNEGFTPFGPDVQKDNIFLNLPQVNLHGMDEGLADLKNVRCHFQSNYRRGKTASQNDNYIGT